MRSSEEGRGTIQMTRQLRSIGLSLTILLMGITLIVLVTERAAGADSTGPRLLALSDINSALDDYGVVITDETKPTRHPLLSITGTTLTLEDASIEVFIYSSIPARVDDKQIIQRYVMQVESRLSDSGDAVRVTSARNVLLLYHADSAELAASIHSAARALTLVAAR